jgi:hypothetical protein
VGSPHVATNEPDMTFDNMLQNEAAILRKQLNPNVQFGRPSHSRDGPASLATRCVFLHRCLQNEDARNIVRVAIAATKYLFELLRLG